MNRLANRVMLFGAVLLIWSGCTDKQNASQEKHLKEYDLVQWTEMDGISLVNLLNSPTNLFQGRLIKKRIGNGTILLNGSPPREAKKVILIFEREDGQQFLTGTADASQYEFELVEQLELGKVYHLPKDLKQSGH